MLHGHPASALISKHNYSNMEQFSRTQHMKLLHTTKPQQVPQSSLHCTAEAKLYVRLGRRW